MNEKEYKDKKSYYDYQRVVQYNREIIQLALKEEHQDMFNHVWGCLPSENYEAPPKDWRPADKKYWIPKDYTTINFVTSKEIIDRNLEAIPPLPFRHKPKIKVFTYE
jgi:hypothetical protein